MTEDRTWKSEKEQQRKINHGKARIFTEVKALNPKLRAIP